MPPKARQRPPEVPGISLIEAKSLKPEFKKFKNDDLYFMHAVHYHLADAKQPLQRCLAITPAAVFVCDTNGNMDRATRVEFVESASYQSIRKKKIMGFDESTHVVMKVPREFDIHVSIDKDKDCKLAAEFCRILSVLKKFKVGKELNVVAIAVDAPEDAGVLRSINTAKPEGFMTPQEIISMNKEKQQRQAQLAAAKNEIEAIADEIEQKKAVVAELEERAGAVEGLSGDDVTRLQEQRKELQQKHLALHKLHTQLEIDIAQKTSNVDRLNETLDEERANYKTLVDAECKQADNTLFNQQNERWELRKKAHQREVDRANSKLETLKAKCGVIPEYEGPDALDRLVKRAQQLEHQVTNVLLNCEKEMDAANKMEKFHDMLLREVENVQRDVMLLQATKNQRLEERQQAQRQSVAATAPPPPAPAGAVEGRDADLLGGDPLEDELGPVAPPNAVDPLDDDLLGGDVAAPAPAHAAAADPLDDDLLGGEAPAPAAAPIAEPLDDDL